MAATKRERIDEFMKRLTSAAPFENDAEALVGMARVMREVEDQLSGIPENPLAALTTSTDGRMYPPDERFEIRSSNDQVRVFKQLRHRTYIGKNGAVEITNTSGTVALDLAGADDLTISDLLSGDRI